MLPRYGCEKACPKNVSFVLHGPYCSTFVGLAQTVYGISVYVYMCRTNRIYTYIPYKPYIFRVGPNRISIYTPYIYVPYTYGRINKISPYPYSYTPYVNFSRRIYTPYNTYIYGFSV